MNLPLKKANTKERLTDCRSNRSYSRKAAISASGFCLYFVAGLSSTQAEFNLNFTPDDGSYSSNFAYVSCGMSYLSDANCGSRDNDFDGLGSHIDGTPFYQRMFSSGGETYYQVIVGDYQTDDFAMEYIIKADASTDGFWETDRDGDIARSASAGDSGDRLYNMTKPYDVDGTLSSSSGTGSGNPNRVLIHQLLSDSESEMVFLKDQFAYKPLISQRTFDSDFDSYIEMDMRNKHYLDMTPIDPSTELVHTIELLNADVPFDGGNYDFADRPETAHITAGGFTYSAGTNYGESLGTYNYVDTAYGDDFQPLDKPYTAYCDPSQNPDWSGNGACTNGDGSGGGGGWGGWGGGMGGW